MEQNEQMNEQPRKKSRMELQELALVGLVKAKVARLRHVNLYLNSGKGKVEVKPFQFYKIDCPDPNLRRDGSIWPSPPGVITLKQMREEQTRLIPQEQIH